MTRRSVVVPAYDEAARLGPTLARIAAHHAGADVEVIVVDDGSRDATAAIAAAAGARVLRHAVNRGKGAAVRTGVLAATGDRILVCDADLATPIEAVARLDAALDAGADLAIGSRHVADARIEVAQPWHRRVLGRGFRVLVKRGLGIAARDAMCGFKLMTRAAGRDLFGRARIDRWAFDVEILYLARDRWQVAEVPVPWRHVEGSRVSVATAGPRAALDLIAIRLRGRG
ncbi:MAG: glycosyltransferase [Myxococcales bacterium]|nr:glycosyltransferase [Myxococcales bacterium]